MSEVPMKHFNVTRVVLFLQSMPASIQSLPVPLEIKIGVVLATALALTIISYINHRSHLQKRILFLEETVAQLNTTVSANETRVITLEQCVDFMFTNHTHVQKALYKKLQLEDKYRDSKVLTKHRQEAIQEYQTAKRTVARRFHEV